MWAHAEEPERVRIGLDAFAVCIAGPPRSIVVAPPRQQLRRGHPCAWLDLAGGTLGVLAPLSGAVLAVNPTLGQSPSQLLEEPFGAGWLLLLRPSKPASESAKLEAAPEFARRVARDVAWWQRKVRQEVRRHAPGVGPTLADGRRRVTSLDELLGPQRRAALADFFLASGRATR